MGRYSKFGYEMKGIVEAQEMQRKVFDAAMAWHKAIAVRTRMAFDHDTPRSAINLAELEIDKAELRLEEACRKAEEVEPGR